MAEVDMLSLLTVLISPTVLILLLFGKNIKAYIIDVIFLRIHIKNLKKRTGSAVIVLSHAIDYKVMNKFEIGLMKIEQEGIKDVIFILDTPGGYEFAMTRIANLIRNFNGNFHCYIPRFSMSAGTVIAFACKSVHMGKNSSLGATDPQLGTLFWVYSSKAWQEIIKKKGVKAKDDSIAMALYGKQYTKLIRGILDKFEFLKGKDRFKNLLVSGEIPHSTQFDKVMLRGYGLDIKDIDHPEIYEIIKKSPDALLMKW